MSTLAADSALRHLENELWLKELSFLNDEINTLRRHLPDVYYGESVEHVMETVEHFSDSFRMHKAWLHKMKEELEKIDNDDLDEKAPARKLFDLQMQANRIVNQELKDSFLKLFS